MCPTYPTHLILLDLITSIIMLQIPKTFEDAVFYATLQNPNEGMLAI
jgi:hypothetical protein